MLVGKVEDDFVSWMLSVDFVVVTVDVGILRVFCLIGFAIFTGVVDVVILIVVVDGIGLVGMGEFAVVWIGGFVVVVDKAFIVVDLFYFKFTLMVISGSVDGIFVVVVVSPHNKRLSKISDSSMTSIVVMCDITGMKQKVKIKAFDTIFTVLYVKERHKRITSLF